MKYRYLVVTEFDGAVKGTNDEEEAKNLSGCDEFYVIDTSTSQWMIDGELRGVDEI